MPYEEKKVPAEILMTYKGYNVYRCYKDGQADSPLTYFYQFDEDSEIEFDVTELHTFDAPIGSKKALDYEYHKDIIREAIEHGYLDEYIRKSGFDTLAEIRWPVDSMFLKQWQLLELIKVYDALDTSHPDRSLSVTEYYDAVFRPFQVKGAY